MNKHWVSWSLVKVLQLIDVLVFCLQRVRTVLESRGKSSLWRSRWSWREGWWTSAVSSTLERSRWRPNVSRPWLKSETLSTTTKLVPVLKNDQKLQPWSIMWFSLFSSEHILMLFCFLPPAEKPAADTHTQPSRLSASSSSSDSSSSSSSSSSSDTSESDSGWETDSSYEKMSRWTLFPPSGLNLFKAADGAAGRAGEPGRDGAFPALSSDMKEVPALLPEEPASAGGVRDAPSPAHKEDWGVRWRDKGARARMCLISGDNFPFSPCSLSLCCIDEVYSTQYISFIKKHFMELIYSLIVGTMKLAWAKSFLFVFLSFFSEWIKRGNICVCVSVRMTSWRSS